MRSDRVVVNPPAFGQDLYLLQRVKDLSVQELISELRIEALAVAVLPGTSGFDIKRLCTSIRQPFSQVFRDELRAIVRPDMFWNALHHHDIGQRLDHFGAAPATFWTDQQAFPGTFIDQVQHPHQVRKGGRKIGHGLSDWAIWSVVEQAASEIEIEQFGAHDLRRTGAKLCRKAGGDLEQIKFMLGHSCIQFRVGAVERGRGERKPGL